ncbi:methyltransferase [Pseudovibrio sp. Tun.PSC04-5.I4]|uniref:tRNA1(Val) (adenine(37)-N6)-methyltransferase n=1 Tax=Pseudovibrio sp. Tun.PSC04-5.I4 TaxID=1798213 RepID=UPI00088674BE|nr:methyltransferase [Pseudovibrio sp. Tun.PSC04-5.I4]SDR37722.1 tRNA1(Val) A37 N6-methylase TrmN6 [Pseudovibrio sp. Tun.PSC04-5.I4]
MTSSDTPPNLPQTTQDKFLGGKVMVEQPAKGRHRAGLDAVYLAASLPDDTAGTVFDLGTGVGTAAFCAASRLPNIKAVGVEVDPYAAELARNALSLPENARFADRVKIMESNLTAKGSVRHESGLISSIADHVIMNPPYYDSARFRVTPQSDRAPAHALDDRGIEPWIRTAKDLLKDGGTLSIIFRADGLQDLLDPMQRRFGAIDIIPIRPTADAPATRIILRAVAASKAPLQILPGFTIHEVAGGPFTQQASTVLRDGAGLQLANR